MQEKVLILINERIEHLNKEYDGLAESGRGRTTYMEKIDGGLWQLEGLRAEVAELSQE